MTADIPVISQTDHPILPVVWGVCHYCCKQKNLTHVRILTHDTYVELNDDTQYGGPPKVTKLPATIAMVCCGQCGVGGG